MPELKKLIVAIKRGVYATALKISLPLAEQGDADAQHSLGFMYANGRGVPQDEVDALEGLPGSEVICVCFTPQSGPNGQPGRTSAFDPKRKFCPRSHQWESKTTRLRQTGQIAAFTKPHKV